MRPILISALALVFCSGCFQQIAVDSLTGIMENGFEVLNEESDLDLAGTSIAGNLKLIESVIRTDPGNRDLLMMACRGYASYAMAFVEDDDPVRAREFYRRGLGFGRQLFDQQGKIARSFDGPSSDLEAALAAAGDGDVPAIFWTAVSWGGYVSLGLTDPDALAALPKVEAMMNFVRDRDPGYFYGGADFFLGTIAGSRPPILGGSPEASKEHFDRALSLSGGKFLLTYVYYARTYAVQVQDSVLFGSLLTAVDTASIDVLPAARLSNAVAKRKAALLRGKVNELF
jgi:hypothetical protein